LYVNATNMRKLLIIITFLLSVVVQSQNISCETAIPYIDGDCTFFPPPNGLTQLQRCYSFVAPDSVAFAANTFIQSGSVCSPLTYTLYDSNCNLLSTNTTGSFGNLDSLSIYTVCFSRSCTIGVLVGICSSENFVLPVEMIYFIGESTVKGINLEWATASEINCFGFSLERSTDLTNWINIGFIEGSINSQQITKYSFQDLKPINGINYYKLTQYDRDGRFEVLQIIAIVWNAEFKTNVFRQYNFLGQKIR